MKGLPHLDHGQRIRELEAKVGELERQKDEWEWALAALRSEQERVVELETVCEAMERELDAT